MKRLIRQLLPDRAQRALRGLRHSVLARLYAFSAADLAAALRRVGLHVGDVVMVHSSLDRFIGFRGKPPDVVDMLKQAVGPEGTLLMPTLPFSGSVVDYAAGDPVFDLTRSSSKVGLLTEIFRRSPGVVRSRHPTHSVAAWGRLAGEIVRGHEHAGTPCGPETPYGRLVPLKGKILFLGTDIGAMTFYHYVEEELERDLPFPILTAEEVALRVRDESGATMTCRTRLYDKGMTGRRYLPPILDALRQRGAAREARVGAVPLTLVEARDILPVVVELMRAGVLCYTGVPGGRPAAA